MTRRTRRTLGGMNASNSKKRKFSMNRTKVSDPGSVQWDPAKEESLGELPGDFLATQPTVNRFMKSRSKKHKSRNSRNHSRSK